MSHPFTVAIVQARMGSSRLPGKVLKTIGGRTVIDWVVSQTAKAKMIDEVIVATSTEDKDQVLVDYLNNKDVPVFRGSENDVLGRYASCASLFNPDVVVRVTADCPLIDPTIIDKVIEQFVCEQADYGSNINPASFPHGLDCEVFTTSVLKRVQSEATLVEEREHVTPYIRTRPHVFRHSNYMSDIDLSHCRWTLDYPEDLAFLDELVKRLPDSLPYVTLKDLLAIIDREPNLAEINSSVPIRRISQSLK